MTEIQEKIQKIAETYGYDAQSRQCIEEMAELTQAINKFWRKPLQCGSVRREPHGFSDSEEYQNVVEEIADVSIMLEQMKFFLECGNDVHKIIEQKLARQLGRIEGKDV